MEIWFRLVWNPGRKWLVGLKRWMRVDVELFNKSRFDETRQSFVRIRPDSDGL